MNTSVNTVHKILTIYMKWTNFFRNRNYHYSPKMKNNLNRPIASKKIEFLILKLPPKEIFRPRQFHGRLLPSI